jgi:hypothetical protein
VEVIMMLRMRVLVSLFVGALLLAAAGCGQRAALPTAAVSPERDQAQATLGHTPLGDAFFQLGRAGGFFPLELGNHWWYDRAFVVQIIPARGAPPQPSVSRSTRDALLADTVTLGGRRYVVERDIIQVEGGREIFVQYIWYRQDRQGFYERDIFQDATVDAGAARSSGVEALARAWNQAEGSLADAATRAAYRGARERLARKLALLDQMLSAAATPAQVEAPAPDEITRLRYPLFVGARWIIRDDPRFAARAERLESLDLPAGRFTGWRIRYTSEFFGPRDIVHVWYGRAGYLRLRAHFESEATDEQGNPLGTLLSEQTEWLTGISLVRPGQHDSPGPAEGVAAAPRER